MAFAKIYSAQINMLKAHLISVEVDLTRGLHAFSIVGLPDKAIEESRDRVSSAIKNSGFKSPKQTNMKIVVSLAPADIRKEGPAFDLPIALGYLSAVGELSVPNKRPDSWSKQIFVGELALDGTVRPVTGALSFARMAAEKGFTEIFVPLENAGEASMIKNIKVFGVESLDQIISHLLGKNMIVETIFSDLTKRSTAEIKNIGPNVNLDDIAGHDNAKRALIIAATGRHSIGLFGPPGTGKSMLAKALHSIMPSLSPSETLEVMEIYSALGATSNNRLAGDIPPVRAPHHTSSYVSIIGGGGKTPRPGEITLAHRGVLFMDEFPEFDRKVLESLRQPLEDKYISISRTGGSERFPCDFILVVAMNPCPCGKRDIKGKRCTCSAADIARYKRKLSGPIMDRIDMWIEVSETDYKKLLSNKKGSAETDRARKIVRESRNRNQTIKLSIPAKQTLEDSAAKYDLSGRGLHRVLKVAQTIAKIESSKIIEVHHILEALQYRQRI